MDFGTFFVRATEGREPYRYQERLGEHGLPELLEVPTGAGKTLAVLLGWLWRKVEHPDAAVRTATPSRMAYVLPLRVLVEQTITVAQTVVGRLGLADRVTVHGVLGGEGRAANSWREAPERLAIFVGTQDMLLSRALNRAYGVSRFVAPIDFGMFNSGTHWVYDEIQLMGAGLPTSRQLHGLRDHFGTASPCSSTWMSATVDMERLSTVDLPGIGTHHALTDNDRTGPLAQRLEASKTVHRLAVDASDKDYSRALAGEIHKAHRVGTRTIAVLNTVRRATQVYAQLKRLNDGGGPTVVLLHSRFRPPERSAQLMAAMAEPTPSRGTIVVTTQVLEAGVDVSSTTLFTEAAPWSSVVQRAGRCNRDGLAEGARLLWAEPPVALPYEDSDIASTVRALSDLEGVATTPPALAGMSVTQARPEHAVLRRRDLVELFDNAPDLSGNDIDVSRFIRDIDELDVQVAWRPLGGRPPTEADPPSRDELCPAPVNELKELMKGDGQRPVWRFDAQADTWVRAAREEVRPGRVLIMDAAQGGYLPEQGWSPKSRAEVPVRSPAPPDPQARTDDAVGSDHATWAPGRWVPLVEHLLDTEAACRELFDGLQPLPGIHADHRTAAEVAARLHDLGKAHPVFQATMEASAGGRTPPPGGPWAKSGGPAKPRHGRPHFRHELVTALLLTGSAAHLLDELSEAARDLAVYLAAAHHGKVRLAVRSLPDEKRPDQDGARFALGVWEGDEVPSFDAPGGQVPATRLDLGAIALGRTADDRPSWTSRALALRDAPDLGPFRLGFLEAVVRLADWRASALGETPRA